MGVEFSVGWESVDEFQAAESEGGAPFAHMTSSNFRRVMEEGFGLDRSLVGVEWPQGFVDPEVLLARTDGAKEWALAQPDEWVAGGGWMPVMMIRLVDVVAVCAVAKRMGRPVVWA
jgi:hypothetical protein